MNFHQHLIGSSTLNLDFRSEEHTSESSHEWISYAVFCLKKKKMSMVSGPRRKKRSLPHTLSHSDSSSLAIANRGQVQIRCTYRRRGRPRAETSMKHGTVML